MLLLNQELRARLIANSKSRGDHTPVVKFLNPVGSGNWLFLGIYPTASRH